MALLITGNSQAQAVRKKVLQYKGISNIQLETGFATPPDSVKPYVYWYWLSDNISKEGISKDLESMARIGIGEAFIGNIGLDDLPYGKIKVLSEEWWQLVEFAIREGKRLGVNIGMFNSPGWSQSGGPWVKPSQSMRYLVATETIVDGGNNFNEIIKPSNDSIENFAVLAYPYVEISNSSIHELKPIIHSTSIKNPSVLLDGKTDSAAVFSMKSNTAVADVDITLKKSFTARSIVLQAAPTPFAVKILVKINENGHYKTVKEFLFDRTNPAYGVGPMAYGPVAIALDDITASQFRLTFQEIISPDTSLQLGFKEITISSKPILEKYIEKQLGKMHQTPFPLWKEYQWDNQKETGTAEMKVDAAKVIELTKLIAADGRLSWTAPAGKWKVVKINLQTTNAKNSPSSPESTGLEVDKMNKQHLANHFNAYIGQILKRMPAQDRTAFKHVVADSYEVGSQNWTDGLADEFKKVYGYDAMQWLPVLTGNIVESADKSNRFLWDLRRLIANKIAYDYVGGLRELCDKNGLRLWLENYGHWGFPSEFLMYGGQSHDIGGEFWVEGELGNIECKAASSAAHIYGVNKVFAESFTGGGLPFQRYPAYLKKRGDWSFTEGVNHVLLHVYAHQAYEDKNPGMNAWFGTEFNRKNTWFEKSKAWVDYERRCMFMLQQGLPVNDVCYFIGEDAPKMTGVRNPELPKGYGYDYINAEVLLKKATIKNGKIVLPDGLSYSLLVLPPIKTMRPELAIKIKQLVAEGMAVLGAAPERSPSLQNYSTADAQVQQVANELWGDNPATMVKRNVGKGKIFSGMSVKSVLDDLKVEEDMRLAVADSILFTHRVMNGTDIYFITNQTDRIITTNPTFRVANRQPELWDATTGKWQTLKQFTSAASNTTVPMVLQPAQSYFVVFRNPISAIGNGINFPGDVIVQKLNKPWKVTFDATKNGPLKPVTFSSLQDWSAHTNDSIKYYSGTATYLTYFTLNAFDRNKKLKLNLGNVKVMATVKLNGKVLGTLWTAPYAIDISTAITGNNKLEIEVVNLWVNRLIGDSRLPKEKRSTWTSSPTFKPEDKLEASGLIGPVTITSVNE